MISIHIYDKRLWCYCSVENHRHPTQIPNHQCYSQKLNFGRFYWVGDTLPLSQQWNVKTVWISEPFKSADLFQNSPSEIGALWLISRPVAQEAIHVTVAVFSQGPLISSFFTQPTSLFFLISYWKIRTPQRHAPIWSILFYTDFDDFIMGAWSFADSCSTSAWLYFDTNLWFFRTQEEFKQEQKSEKP